MSFVPGLGSKTLAITSNRGTKDNIHGVSFRIESRFAIGYEHKYFYLGLGSLISSNGFKYENIEVATSTTKFRFYIGKRFNVMKKEARED